MTLTRLVSTAGLIGALGVAALSIDGVMRLVTGGVLVGAAPVVIGSLGVVLLALACVLSPAWSLARTLVLIALIVQIVGRTAVSTDVPIVLWAVTAAHTLAPYLAFVAGFVVARDRSSAWDRLFGLAAMVASACWVIGDWAPVVPPLALSAARAIVDLCFCGVLALPEARVLRRQASTLWASADIR